jgi:hypothetical protein
LLALLALVIPASTRAATVLHVDVAEATRLSQWVVRAEVVALETLDLRAQGDSIYTEVTLAVSEVYRGRDVPARVVMRLQGGIAADGLALTVPGMPRVAVGDEGVFFLERVGNGLVPCGLEQGVWRISQGPFGVPLVYRTLDGLSLMVRGPEGKLSPAPEPAPARTKLLAQLIAEIAAAPTPE